jgi:hypothetical protein
VGPEEVSEEVSDEDWAEASEGFWVIVHPLMIGTESGKKFRNSRQDWLG